MSQTTAKHAHTTWKEYRVSDMETSMHEPFAATLSDGQKLFTNYVWIPRETSKKLTPKMFILDKQDDEWNEKLKEKNEKITLESMMTLTNFLKCRPDKRIYVRGFPATNGGNEVCRVMAEEVLEIIPLLIKQQGTLLEDLKVFLDRMRMYQKKWSEVVRVSQSTWENNDKSMYNSIDMDEFKHVLEEFDINKELITVVPDIVYVWTSNMHLVDARKLLATTAPDGQDMIHSTQSILYLFQLFVYPANWNKDYCKEHKNCKQDFQKKILDVMNNYANMDQGVFLSCDHSNIELYRLMEHCTYRYHKDDFVDNEIVDYSNPNGDISMNRFKKICQEIDIIPNMTEMFQMKEKVIAVYRARIYHMIGLIQYFVPIDMVQLRNALKSVLFYKVPPHFRNQLQEILNRAFQNEHCHQSESDSVITKTDKERYDKMKEYAERRKQLVQEKKAAKKNKGGKSVPIQSSAKIEKPNNIPELSEKVEPKEREKNKVKTSVELKGTTSELNEDSESLTKSVTNKKSMGKFEAPQVDTSCLKKSDSINIDDSKVVKEVSIFNPKTKSYETKLVTWRKYSKTEKEVEAEDTGIHPSISAKNQQKQTEPSKSSIDSGMKMDSRGSSSESEIKVTELNINKKESEVKSNTTKEKKMNDSQTRKPESAATPNESKCCPKCLRTSEMCNEAKRELKATQNKLKTSEDKAKKFDALEKKMKEMAKEMEQLKKTNSDSDREMKKQGQEIKKLKTEIKINKESEAKMRELNKEVTESRNHLQEKIAQLETQLKKSEKQNNQNSQFERELAEKEDIIAELRETNMRVTVRNEEQEKNIKNLVDRLIKCNIPGTK